MEELVVPEESHIKTYLDMQHSQYERRASVAIVYKDQIRNDAVVGSYADQLKFPYDENIFKHFSKNKKESTVLEYGCGPGRNLVRIAPDVKKVVGVDISKNNIENARMFLNLNGLDNFDLYVTTGDNIPIQEEKFDLVFSVICLQHICSYTIRKRILSEMSRVAAPGGMVVVQMGFNVVIPSHTHYVSYHEEQLLGIHDTNGFADGCVTNDSDLTSDFCDVGLGDIKTWHTDMVLDTSHDDWIWCCGAKQ